MKFKHLIVGAVMTAFSPLTLAAPESSPTTTPKAADMPATKAKSTKKAEQGKTRGLKSKKGKECGSSDITSCSNPPPDPPKPN